MDNHSPLNLRTRIHSLITLSINIKYCLIIKKLCCTFWICFKCFNISSTELIYLYFIIIIPIFIHLLFIWSSRYESKMSWWFSKIKCKLNLPSWIIWLDLKLKLYKLYLFFMLLISSLPNQSVSQLIVL